MHLSDSVLPILARKPAPIQMTFAAYPGSTGLKTIDYRITDAYLDDPRETDNSYCEKSIHLPETFWCYQPWDATPVAELPALINSQITFGCLNEFCKINPKMLALWAKVLKRVENSRLLLLAPAGDSRQRILECLQKLDVSADRLMFVGRQRGLEYLRTYDLIDIGLDTLPYNGHTTSLDSVWMGVPVVTRIGQTVVGRAGWSQLSNLGLTELAAKTDEEFASIAANLAADVPKLADLRKNLRSRMERSPLMNAKQFTRNIENAYRSVWQQWCLEQNSSATPRVVVQVSPMVRRKPAKAA
jgi:predicted O-linked N-acetylglucosamine transferase (SPINDLY family)